MNEKKHAENSQPLYKYEQKQGKKVTIVRLHHWQYKSRQKCNKWARTFYCYVLLQTSDYLWNNEAFQKCLVFEEYW